MPDTSGKGELGGDWYLAEERQAYHQNDERCELVKAKFNKARGKMSEVKKDELVTSLKETTLNIAASNWKQKVNQDCSLNAAWRQEKVEFIEDYIGREATR